MKVTQKDIARRLNVSASLVSRALAGTAGDIGASAETIRKIREEAERLKYSPSAAALTLRGRSAKTIGLIVKDFEDPFFGHLVRELQRMTRGHGYSLLMTGCESGGGVGLDLASLMKYELDGLILGGSDFAPDGLDTFIARGLPVVQIGAGVTGRGVVSVSMDQPRGIALLTGYLVKLGHRDIGYIGDASDSNLRRESVVAEALKRAGAGVRKNWFVRSAAIGPEGGYEGMKQLLKGGKDSLPTAVVLADDMFALSALRACYEGGIRVPGDISLAGVDDIPFAQMMIPALTTVRQPIEKMVRAAFDFLVGSVNGDRRLNVVIEPELVIRESCSRPRAGRKEEV